MVFLNLEWKLAFPHVSFPSGPQSSLKPHFLLKTSGPLCSSPTPSFWNTLTFVYVIQVFLGTSWPISQI